MVVVVVIVVVMRLLIVDYHTILLCVQQFGVQCVRLFGPFTIRDTRTENLTYLVSSSNIIRFVLTQIVWFFCGGGACDIYHYVAITVEFYDGINKEQYDEQKKNRN